MRLMGINDNVQRMNYLRRWAGMELTKIWEKEERMEVEGNREGGGGGAGRHQLRGRGRGAAG